MAIRLPDCAHFPEDVVSDDLLDSLDSAALIRALAEEGVKGARRLLEERVSTDRQLADRIQRLRERLRRQAGSRIARLMEDYQHRAETLDLVVRRRQEEIDAEIRALEQRLKEARGLDLSRVGDSDLLDEVQAALLVPSASWRQPPPRPSWWERLKAWFARFVARLKRLFGRKAKAPPPTPRDRSIRFAQLSASGRSLGRSEIGEAIQALNREEQEELRENVADRLRAKGRDLRREAESKRKEAEQQRRTLEEEQAEARRRAEKETDERVRRSEAERLTRELKERGFVAERAGELLVTYGLIKRFARILLEEETRKLPGEAKLSLRGSASTGLYEKARLFRPEEIAHLDIPSSLLSARQQGSRHIDEASSFIYREITTERVHVVLMFDKSGSMSEQGKLAAAKKALLALYVAIRQRYFDAVVDVIAFDNDVRVLDLVELWECAAGSFTNTGEALHTAHLLLRSSRATRKEVYVITDGLPESYTDVDGRVRSGNLDAAMEHALARAGELATITPIKFSIILLKSTHPEYEAAGRAIARVLGGELVVTDPESLGVELLVRWTRGGETTHRAATTAAPMRVPPSPHPGAGRGRRRRADRRMGG